MSTNRRPPSFRPLFSLLSELLEASLPSRVIALDLASLPGNRWKADLHDPRLREEADFLSVRSFLTACASGTASATAGLQNRCAR